MSQARLPHNGKVPDQAHSHSMFSQDTYHDRIMESAKLEQLAPVNDSNHIGGCSIPELRTLATVKSLSLAEM